jgi:dolichyl-phosphate beta-glucosyltransferase
VTDTDACRQLLAAPWPTSPNTDVASRPGLTLVLPCFNEAERLPGTLAALLAELPQGPGEVEVLVVDDGSTDETLAVACAIATRDARVRVIHSRPNRGKGFGVRTGVLAARGELVVFTDADGSYGPGDIGRIVAALTDAPVAIGFRDAALATGPLVRRLASLLFNRVIQALLGLPFRDTQCGLKGFRRQAALQLFGQARLDGFAFDAELLFLAHRFNLQVMEVRVRAEERDGSKVQLAVDALRMLRDVLIVRRAATKGTYDPVHPKPGEHGSPQGGTPDLMVGRVILVEAGDSPARESVSKPGSYPSR